MDQVETGIKEIHISADPNTDSTTLATQHVDKTNATVSQNCVEKNIESEPQTQNLPQQPTTKMEDNADSSNDSYSVKNEPAEPEAEDSVDSLNVSDERSIRRSGRIKTIKTTRHREIKCTVKPNERKRSIPTDEDSQSTMSYDTSIDGQSSLSQSFECLVKTKEQLEKEQIDREEGLRSFVNIVDSEYRSERLISKEAKKMTCDCFMTQSEIDRDELGCGDDCLNRMLLIECGSKCSVGDRCSNRRFQRHENADCTILKTEKKGYGLFAQSFIPAGVFVMEYVGEVLNSKQFEKRANDYSKQMNAHYYFMALRNDCIIDATKKGNVSRFINHSCEPNAETQKWTVNGELRIGFFSSKSIMPDEEITFDYQFQRYG